MKEHPAYRALQNKLGTSTLAKLLNQVSAWACPAAGQSMAPALHLDGSLRMLLLVMPLQDLCGPCLLGSCGPILVVSSSIAQIIIRQRYCLETPHVCLMKPTLSPRLPQHIGVQVLMRHIRDCLPEIKSKLNMMMISVQLELGELGQPTDAATANNLGATLLTLLSKFATNFQVQRALWRRCLIAFCGSCKYAGYTCMEYRKESTKILLFRNGLAGSNAAPLKHCACCVPTSTMHHCMLL